LVALLALFCFPVVACKPRTDQVGRLQRVAILPAEILVSDESLRWAALGSAFVLQEDLGTSSSILPLFAPNQSTAYGQGATEVFRATVERRGERLRIAAVLTDLASQKNELTIESEGPASEGVIARLDDCSKRIDPQHASRFSTRNDAALRAFTAAASTANQEERVKLLEQAVSMDPAFGLAQTALLESAPSRALPDPSVVARFAPLDRARFAALVTRINHLPIPALAAASDQVLAVAPNNVEALAQRGWLAFLQGKPTEGERLLRKAIGRTPQSLPLQLQLAQGLVASRRFTQASQLLESLAAGNSNLLPALAVGKLLSGDLAGAHSSFSRFTSLLPKGSPARTFAEGQWSAMVEKSAPSVPDASAQGPLAPGYRAFLEKRFPEAISFWQEVVRQSSGTDLRARAMLAASLESTGQMPPLQVLPYLPDFSDPYAPVAFNEMRRLLKM
jgi:tetratricopeptide (TPR) repeat protein